MKNDRRDFLKLSGLTVMGIMKGDFPAAGNTKQNKFTAGENIPGTMNPLAGNKHSSVIGAYGEWTSGLTDNRIPSLSFRNKTFSDLESWKRLARERLAERMATPDTGGLPHVTVKRQYEFDGLHVEELSWQLPYGPPTDAVLLKPLNATGKLPGILAFHDHAGVKYFGTRKITRTSDDLHPMMISHQKESYEDTAWANEIAKRGYVVLVPDAFPFASRRVLLKDVEPQFLRNGLTDDDPEKAENINAYNKWAGEHEHIMSKALFCAGTTWPGVFFAEDRVALDILCGRADVDNKNIGCGGLSGGGMRTVFMAGQDDRIKCAVCVGFMSTWNDFAVNKCYTHTWMTYVPILPNEMDFPEIIGLRAPLPTMVLNDSDDELYTPEGMKRADEILREVFAKAGASDRYKCSFYPGPHKFDRAMQKEAFDWFDKWLR